MQLLCLGEEHLADEKPFTPSYLNMMQYVR